jgi:hypothetical protein
MGVVAKGRAAQSLVLLACLCTALALVSPAGAMDFPRQGVAAIPNGVSTPFAGQWSVGYPEGDGMINGDPKVACSAPVELVSDGDARLLYRSPSGAEVGFDLMEFSGRTSWLPEQGESVVAVWTSADEFFAYSVDMGTGKARWDDPSVYRRC